MKRIRAKFDNRDRIVCVTGPGVHQFFYQPARSKERYWLFKTKKFGGSIFEHFRKYGCRVGEKSFSLTIRELYQFDDYHNPKLTRLMNRIPGQIQYVIREQAPSVREAASFVYINDTATNNSHDRNDHESAA